MNKLNEHNQDNKATKNLFSSFIPEEPSVNFTKNTMNQVMQTWTTQPINTHNPLSLINKI